MKTLAQKLEDVNEGELTQRLNIVIAHITELEAPKEPTPPAPTAPAPTNAA